MNGLTPGTRVRITNTLPTTQLGLAGTTGTITALNPADRYPVLVHCDRLAPTTRPERRFTLQEVEPLP